MGLSSSKTRTTTTQNSNQTENSSGTQMPVTPLWLLEDARDYVNRIGAFADMDPNAFVAPASPLQQMAWQNAPWALSGWQGQALTAAQMAQAAGQTGPNLAGAAAAAGSAPKGTGGPLQAPAGGPAFQAQASSYAAPTLGPAALASAQGYAAPALGHPSLVSGQGYSAPAIAAAQGYAAARIGQPIGAQAAQVAPAATVDPYAFDIPSHYGYTNTTAGRTPIAGTPGATASPATAGNIAGGIDAFRNPYVSEVVDASLADFDASAGRTRAAQAAQAARAGAFGGSRLALREAATEGELARARGTLASGLHALAFDSAAGLAAQQAGLSQQNSQFNAGNQTEVSLANAGQEAARALAQGSLDQQTSLFNATTANDQARYFADQQNATARLNQQTRAGLAQGNQAAANARAAQQAGLDQQAGQFNADLAGRTALAQAGLDTDAARYAADMFNQRGLAQAGLDATARHYSAGAMQAADAANQSAHNQFALAQGAMGADAARFNADLAARTSAANAAAQNQFALSGAELAAQAGQLGAQLGTQVSLANAGANNQMSQFNAQQSDAAQARALQAAQLLMSGASDYGAGTRADLQTLAALGDQQRGIEQAYALAPLAQLQAMGQLSGMTPYDILVGRAINTTGTTTGTATGTNVTQSTPSLFSQLLAAGNLAARFI